VDALNEDTGDEVWSYVIDERIFQVSSDKAQIPLIVDKESVFLNLPNHFFTLDAKTGQLLWQLTAGESTKTYQYLHIESDDVIAVYSVDTSIVQGSARGASSTLEFYDLSSGIMLWSIGCCNAKIIYSANNSVDIGRTSLEVNSFKITRFDATSGEILRDCPVDSGAGQWMYRRYLFPEVFVYSPKDFFADGNWLYNDTTQVTNISSTPNNKGIVDLYKFPQCPSVTMPLAPEDVSDTLERYYLPTLMYAEITPFNWVAGPYNSFYLFQNEGQLYKVAVPEKSFTYLYHNKQDNSVYVAPKFEEIVPLPFEPISGVEGKIVKVQLIDNFIVAMLEDGTLQIIDFDTSRTLLKTRTDLLPEEVTVSFQRVGDILVLSSYADNQTLSASKIPV
jgi:hypothetical protein